MHPLHQAVGKSVPDELQLLITDRWIFLGNSLHRAVKFADAPTRSRRGWLHVADVTLLQAEVHKRPDSLLKRCISQLLAIERGLI